MSYLHFRFSLARSFKWKIHTCTVATGGNLEVTILSFWFCTLDSKKYMTRFSKNEKKIPIIKKVNKGLLNKLENQFISHWNTTFLGKSALFIVLFYKETLLMSIRHSKT